MNQSKKVLDSPQALKRARDERPRRARFAALILLAAALALALTFALRPPSAPEEADSSIVLFSRDKTLLDTISVARSGADAYTLVNLNDYDLSDGNDVLGKEYEVRDRPDFAVSTAKVLSMERYAGDLTAERMAAASATDLAEFGLEAPAATVTIGYRDGTREVLRLGSAVPTGFGYYLNRAGDPAVYVVADSVYEAFCRPLEDLAQTEEEKASLAAAQAARETEAAAASTGTATPAN